MAVHEQTALAGLVAIAVHGITLLGDPWLNPGLGRRRGPLRDGLQAALHRPRDHRRLPGRAARAQLLRPPADRRRGSGARPTASTVVVYVLGVVHALGAGTDASAAWLRAGGCSSPAPSIGGLFVYRLCLRSVAAARRPAPERLPSPQRSSRGAARSADPSPRGGVMSDRRRPDRRRRPRRPALRRDAAPPRLRRRRSGSSAPSPSRPTTARRCPRSCWPARLEDESVAYRPPAGTRTTRSSCCSAHGAVRLDPRARTCRSSTGHELRLREAARSPPAARAAAAAVPRRATRTCTTLRTLADARRLRAALVAGRTAGDRRRRLHRPGGRGDRARGSASR